MEDSWENWFSHLDMNGENSFNQCQTNTFVNIEGHRRDITHDQQATFPSQTETETLSLYPSPLEEIGFKGQSSNSSNAGIWEPLPKQDYSSCLNPNSNCDPSKSTGVGNQNFEARASQGTKRARPRSYSETQDHIMSERRRRQEMAERFIALSAIIPGLKKIDKASVLGAAIDYVKQLQGRIAALEKESKKKITESMIFIKKSRACSASRETNSNDYCGSNQLLPVVEAIGLQLEKEVLIRIHCEKRKGILPKLLALLENIHLSIAWSSVLPFGNSTLNITIIAQMGEEYNMTVNELAKSLRQDLLKLFDVQL